MKISLVSLLLVLMLLLGTIGSAEEGMWMPHQMKELDLKSKGLQMDPGSLFKEDGTGLMSAVVKLGGATGEIVSSDGLILTNHHVAFRAIQRASDKQNDYIKHGFIAKDRNSEIPARGYYADVLLGYEDVTSRVNGKLKPGMSPEKKEKAITAIEKKLIANGEKKGPDLRCAFKSMYSGNKYYLFTYKRLQDIRLVFAPPESIGSYGGDIDNWMWPRHTGDFSFLRAYVSKNNVGVAFNKNNVPYKPKSVIKLSLDGVKHGDFTFIMGYPGSTYLNYTFSQYTESIGDMKRRINQYKDIIDFFELRGKDNRGIQIKYASRVKGLNNGYKNRMGKLEGLEKNRVGEKKKHFEKKYKDWITKDEGRKKKYDGILEKIDDFFKRNSSFYLKVSKSSALVSSYFGSTLLSQAHKIYRTVEERQKKDSKRELGFQERDFPGIKQSVRLAEKELRSKQR